MIERFRVNTSSAALIAFLIAGAILAPAARAADNGGLDAAFGGGDGVTLTRFAGQFSQDAAASALMPDGDIVVAGGAATSATADPRFLLAAYDPAGRALASFGSGGRVTTHFTGSGGERANALLADAGGRLTVAGQVDGDPGPAIQDQFGMVRYDATGKVDPSFGTGGGLRVGFFAGRSAEATAILEQPDGKIVVAGRTSTAAGTRFALTRLLPDGKGRDPSFGADGRVTTELTPGPDFESIAAAAIDPEGRIVVAGEAGGELAVARYAADGSLDATFDGDGLKLLRFSDRGQSALALRATGLAIDPSGRIVATGDATFSFFDRRFVAVRLTPSGSLDPKWNGSGLSLVDFTSLVSDHRALGAAGAMVRAGDGKYVIGGDVDLNPDRTGDTRPRRRFALVRLTASGRLDRTFGGDGRVITQLSSADESIATLLRQPDGMVVAAGAATDYTATGNPARIALARYRAVKDTEAPELALTPVEPDTPAAISKSGRLTFDAAADEAQTASLTFTLAVPAQATTTGTTAPRTVTLGHATLRLRSAGDRTVSLKLTSTGRAAFAGLTSARVTVARALVDGAGNRTRDHVAFTLQ
jgi:uncharacterized delta-60 repeat protein